MEGLIVMLALALLAVPVLLIVALVSLAEVKRRVARLEAAMDTLRQAAAAPPRAPQAPQAPRGETDATVAAPWPAPVPANPAPAPVPDAVPPPPVAAAVDLPAAARATAPPPRMLTPPPRAPARPDMLDVAVRAVKRWFTVGNVPVKVGMLVLFAGVAALLKYAADQGWMVLPPELKLAGVAAAALAALAFAWRKRDSNRTFALSLQGGAIGVLLLVVFAAFKLFALVPAGAAFALSIVLVAGAGMLAVLQRAMALAVFALLAGFLAPIWLSTGSGNHVALFSYYAVLNVAIAAIAWFRAWRLLNLLGFVFTFGIGVAWGALDYAPEKFASTQPFLCLFFVLYLLIPILFARQRLPGRRDFIEGCLVFGMPLVAFSLEAGLLEGARMALAGCALGLGVLYATLAWWLRRRGGFAALLQAYALLAVGFATLAVPLALSAQATASIFALEGAGLAWLGVRQQRRVPQFSGAGLQLVAAMALLIGLDHAGAWAGSDGAQRMFANAGFMGALLIALAGFASAWVYQSARRADVAIVYYAWGLAWWVGNGVHELGEFLALRHLPDALLAFAAVSGWLAAEVQRRRPAAALGWTCLAALVSAVPLMFWQTEVHRQPFAGMGGLAWLVYLLLGLRALACLRDGGQRSALAAQFAWWLILPLLGSLLLHWLADDVAGLQGGWQMAATVLPWAAVIAVALHHWRWLSLPLGARFDAWRGPLLTLLFVVSGLWWLVSLWHPGDAAPLPWLPVCNPLELMQLAVLVLLLRWQRPPGGSLAPARIALLAGLAFLWVTSVVLHAVHHWGGEPWGDGLLSGSLAQTSLSVTWSVLGVLGWVMGSRRGQRMLWLAGAVLMGVVLVKLVLVDRQHLGNLLGIGSFIAYGLMCTVVGYLAPAPPRQADAVAAEVPA